MAIENTNNIIEVNGLGKEFNGVWVLKDIKFDLKPGEIHSLVGENGAGKSTFIKMLSGVYQPSVGHMKMEGKSISFSNVKQSESAGIRTVHQEVQLIPYFSIYKNIFVGSEEKIKIAGISCLDDKKMKQKAKDVIKRLGIDFDINKPAQLLNASMKRIVEISKILIHEPKVVIFDEPTTSLGQEERKRLLKIIMGLKEKGLSIIYISHNLEEITSISDRITVFRDGMNIDTISGKDASIEKMIPMMLGNKTYSGYIRKESSYNDEVYFEAQNISTDRLKNVSFKLRKGEILGIAGVVGAGKTEIAKAMFGLDKLENGYMKVKGKPYSPTPQNAISLGMALVPEERQAEGLIPNYCVLKNTTLTYLNKWCRGGIIDKNEEIKVANEYIDKLSIKTTGHSQLIKFLSGGNQQKVILSRWLNGDFSIGIFDEPTKGIDIKAKEDIYLLLEDLAKKGKSILMLSSYLPELLCLCDRILVVHEGELVGEFNTNQLNAEEKIMAAMLGGRVQ
jgi:ribose transport system ATP-binding protein